MPQLPYSIELHDSKLFGVRSTQEQVTLELRPSYVHRDGKGWRQNADIEIRGVRSEVNTALAPVRIADGDLKTPSGPYHNLLMLPLSDVGPVRLRLELETGEVLELDGSAISVRMLGEPVFVELFN
ncbi:MAG: hypothetical protein WAV95_09200 [Azonexus sp.]